MKLANSLFLWVLFFGGVFSAHGMQGEEEATGVVKFAPTVTRAGLNVVVKDNGGVEISADENLGNFSLYLKTGDAISLREGDVLEFKLSLGDLSQQNLQHGTIMLTLSAREAIFQKLTRLLYPRYSVPDCNSSNKILTLRYDRKQPEFRQYAQTHFKDYVLWVKLEDVQAPLMPFTFLEKAEIEIHHQPTNIESSNPGQ